jgi:hypothetical protein
MTGFCSRCGATLPRLSRFCGNCGARLTGDAGQPVLSASELNEITQEVPPVRAPGDDAGDPTLGATPDRPSADRVATPPTIRTVAAAAAQKLRRGLDDTLTRFRPRVERWWAGQRGHSARNSMVVCGVLLFVAITFAWTAGGGGGGSTGTVKKTRAPRPANTRRLRRRAPSTTSPPPAAPDPRVYTYVAQLEGILQQSAGGRAQLAGTVRGTQPACGSASPQAEQQLTSVVENRSGLVHQLDVLGPGPNPATQVVFSVLHQALEASTQADVEYRNWNAALGGASPDQCSGDPSADAALAAAHAFDSSASTYKAQFVALFNPLAAQLGLPPWSATAF